MIDFTLMEHQREAVWLSDTKKDLFLAWDPGTGKTCTTIQMIRNRCMDKGTLRRTLILAPMIVLKNWKREFAMFSNIDQNNIMILEGSVKKRIAAIEKHANYSGIFITNYDVMQNVGLVAALLRWKPEILVCDESHNLKSYKSKRAKSVLTIAHACKHRYLLTGTPVLNNAMDLFMQYNILDGYLGPNSTLGTNFFAFRSRYFRDDNIGWAGKPGYYPKWVPREAAYKSLMDNISQKTLRITKKDCLDLPDLVTQDFEVSVGADQKRAYEEMREGYITYVESELRNGTPRAVVARLAITKALRLLQIITGFYRTEDGELIRVKSNPRLDALRDLLETITPGNKVIVWACFKENYAMIADLCHDLGIKYVELHGGVSPKDKQIAVDSFNNDEEIRVLIGNQGAGGVGINLVAATYSIYYSRGFKLGDDIQSESRNHRRGSEIHDKITRINLVAKNSIDELIHEALQNKQNISDEILNFTHKLKGRLK